MKVNSAALAFLSIKTAIPATGLGTKMSIVIPGRSGGPMAMSVPDTCSSTPYPLVILEEPDDSIDQQFYVVETDYGDVIESAKCPGMSMAKLGPNKCGEGNITLRTQSLTVLPYMLERHLWTFNDDGSIESIMCNGEGKKVMSAEDLTTQVVLHEWNESVSVARMVWKTFQASWDIIFLSMNSDFSASSVEELALTYKVGHGQDVSHQLYSGGCESPTNITGIAFNVTNATDVLITGDPEMEMEKNLTLSYSFDKQNITSANFWNSNGAESKAELCQVVQLTYPDQDGNTMIVVEDKRNVTIAFDLGVDFTTANITLDGAIISSNNTATSYDGYITAYKCSGFGSQSDTNNLPPNTELNVCIKSSSIDVEIESVDTVDIEGIDLEGDESTMSVVGEGSPTVIGLTSLAYANNGREAVVTTRVPVNRFDFEAEGANILVSGDLTLRLPGGTVTRKLLVGEGPSRGLQATSVTDASSEASFKVDVKLQSDIDEQEDIYAMSAADDGAGKSFAILGMVLASVYTFW